MTERTPNVAYVPATLLKSVSYNPIKGTLVWKVGERKGKPAARVMPTPKGNTKQAYVKFSGKNYPAANVALQCLPRVKHRWASAQNEMAQFFAFLPADGNPLNLAASNLVPVGLYVPRTSSKAGQNLGFRVVEKVKKNDKRAPGGFHDNMNTLTCINNSNKNNTGICNHRDGISGRLYDNRIHPKEWVLKKEIPWSWVVKADSRNDTGSTLKTGLLAIFKVNSRAQTKLGMLDTCGLGGGEARWMTIAHDVVHKNLQWLGENGLLSVTRRSDGQGKSQVYWSPHTLAAGSKLNLPVGLRFDLLATASAIGVNSLRVVCYLACHRTGETVDGADVCKPPASRAGWVWPEYQWNRGLRPLLLAGVVTKLPGKRFAVAGMTTPLDRSETWYHESRKGALT